MRRATGARRGRRDKLEYAAGKARAGHPATFVKVLEAARGAAGPCCERPWPAESQPGPVKARGRRVEHGESCQLCGTAGCTSALGQDRCGKGRGRRAGTVAADRARVDTSGRPFGFLHTPTCRKRRQAGGRAAGEVVDGIGGGATLWKLQR